MVAGGVSDPALGAEVAARIEPWVAMVELKLAQLMDGSVLLTLVAPRDVAFAIVAGYFGIDMLSHLQRDRTRADSLLDLATRLADSGRHVPARAGPGSTMRRTRRSISSLARSATQAPTSPAGCSTADAR